MRAMRGWFHPGCKWRRGVGLSVALSVALGVVLGAVLATGVCAMAQTAGSPAPAMAAGKTSAAAQAKSGVSATETLSATLDSAPTLRGSETTTSIPLKITMTPSETPLKIGSTSNLAATIQNISNAPVAVQTSSLLLTTPAIVGGAASRCVTDIPEANVLSASQPWVTLQPQDTVTVLFNLSQSQWYAALVRAATESETAFKQEQRDYQRFQRSCTMGWDGPMQRLLDFSPGNYDYYLQGQFTLCADTKSVAVNPACQLPYRNFSASASFPVAIDQTTIVIFAVLGGWLALLYVIFSRASQPGSILHDFNAALQELAPEEKSKNPFGRFVQKLMTSSGMRAVVRFLVRLIATAILSAAVTVISSRISNPSLPIRISVMDAWGAMTMGFLSYFIGAKFINSLTNWSGDGTPAGTAANAASAHPVGAPPAGATPAGTNGVGANPASNG